MKVYWNCSKMTQPTPDTLLDLVDFNGTIYKGYVVYYAYKVTNIYTPFNWVGGFVDKEGVPIINDKEIVAWKEAS